MTDREIRDQLPNSVSQFADEKVAVIGKTATDIYMSLDDMDHRDHKDLDRVRCCRQIAEVLHGVLAVSEEEK